MEGKKKEVKLISENCVNSSWTARWLAEVSTESCQCIVGCKVRVSVEQNGHKPYTYIVTEDELKTLKDEK